MDGALSEKEFHAKSTFAHYISEMSKDSEQSTYCQSPQQEGSCRSWDVTSGFGDDPNGMRTSCYDASSLEEMTFFQRPFLG